MIQLIQAGAGAGKTTSLTQEVARFAKSYQAQEGKWPRVVLTTFTRKATQELKERLLRFCLEVEPSLLSFVQSPTYLNITTMHGLLSQFLAQKGSVLGLPSSFEIDQSQEISRQRKRILHQLIARQMVSDGLREFGFSRLLTALTETEVFHLEGGYQPPTQSDFEETAQSLHREFAGTCRAFLSNTSWPESEKWEAFLEVFQKVLVTLESTEPWSERRVRLSDQLQALQPPRASQKEPGLSKSDRAQFDKLKGKIKKWVSEEEFDPLDWQRQIAVLGELHDLGRTFTQQLMRWKINQGLIETDDLELLSLRVVEESPSAAQDFAEGIHAWFIDEFQDTSPRQLRILEPLMRGQLIYYVGDPQQSIYLFRGSRSEVFFRQAEKVEQQGGVRRYLDTNYRSEPSVLEFINQFFTKIPGTFRAMQPGRTQSDSSPQVQVAQFSEEKAGDELAWLTEKLTNLLQAGVSPKEICLLTRTRKDLETLQKLLLSNGFPVLSHASAQFYDRREILDALALSRFLINPFDDRNLITLLRSPWLGIDDQTLTQWCTLNQGSLWETCLREIQGNAPKSLRILRDLLEQVPQKGLSVCFREGLERLGLLEYAMASDPSGRAEANFFKLINLLEKNGRKPGMRLQQLSGEMGGSSQYEEMGAVADASSPVEPDKINLMTYHGAKGLQFEHVFLPFLASKPRLTDWQNTSLLEDEGLWSMRIPRKDYGSFGGGFLESLAVQRLRKRELEESLRVLYVGMTRAKRSLYLSWAGNPEPNSWAGVISTQLVRIPNSLFSFENCPQAEIRRWGETRLQVAVREPYRVKQTVSDSDSSQSAPLPRLPAFESLWRRHLGTFCHRLFEGLKYHKPEEIRSVLLHEAGAHADKASAALDYVLKLDHPPLLELIKGGEVEWAYSKCVEGQMIQGRVDLWSIHADELWVIDYKTGSPESQEATFQQLEGYANILVEELGWQGGVQLVAVYPFSERTLIRDFRALARQ